MSTAVAERPNTEIAKKPQTPLQRVKGLLESDSFKDAVSKALPKHLTPDRFCRIAINAAMQTPKLMECTQESLFGCLMKLSQYGLEPDGRRAHLIPYENRRAGTVECQLIIDYKGLAELIYRSGLVSVLHADVVCENDVFDYDMGEIKSHKPNYRQPRGPAYAVYAMCRMKDGSSKAEVMSMDEVDSIRKRSRAGNSGPWQTDYNEMARKTVFRRLSKWLPLSPEIRDAVYGDDDTIDSTAETISVSPASSKSDAIADILAKRMEASPADGNGEPPQNEQPQSETPKPTLQELLSKVADSTRKSDLDLIYDQRLHLTADEQRTLEEALNTHAEALKEQQSGGKLPGMK